MRQNMGSDPNPRIGRILEGIAMLVIAVSAILFQRSATSTWAEGREADGRRIAISPIGLREAGSAATPGRECRWWPTLGDADLCAVAAGAEADMRRIRRAYPLAVASLWTSVLALFLVALRIPRKAPSAGIIVTLVVPVLAVLSLWSVAAGAKQALAVLADMNVQVVPNGFASMFAGALLMATAGGLLISSRLMRRS
jgi:hypothetical protein